MKYGSKVLVTGATSGIGKVIVSELLKNGYKVAGASRRPAAHKTMIPISMDVTDDESVAQGVNEAIEKLGGIDILINCAGMGIAGSAEDTAADELMKQMNVNFIGAARICRYVLPHMRKNKNGLIVIIGSVAGFLSIPFQSAYSASKYALEAYTEALRMECAPFNIKACIIEPGDTKTNFTFNRILSKAAVENDAYREYAERAIYKMEKCEINGKDPSTVAKNVLRILRKRKPPIRVTVGIEYKLLRFAMRLAPSILVEWGLKRMYLSKKIKGESLAFKNYRNRIL